MSARYRWLFFDLFDTLVALDEAPYFRGKRLSAEAAGVGFEAFMAAWRATGKRASTGEIPDPFSRATEALKGCGIVDRRKSAEVARLDVETIPRCVRFYDGATEALAALRGAGFHLGLISNATATTAFIVSPLHLRERMDLLIFSYEAKAMKPEPAIYQKALSRAACAATEALFIGDGANRELDGAREVGMATLCLDHPHKADSFRDATNLSSPDHPRVSSFQELLALPELQQPLE